MFGFRRFLQGLYVVEQYVDSLPSQPGAFLEAFILIVWIRPTQPVYFKVLVRTSGLHYLVPPQNIGLLTDWSLELV